MALSVAGTPRRAAAYDDSGYDNPSYGADYSGSLRADGDDLDDEKDDLGSDVTVAYFRDDLAPYGRWFQVPTYGWAWRPYNVATNWEPYTVGRWLYTDYGWTWVSDEPWGRSPYHYGRRLWDDRYGG